MSDNWLRHFELQLTDDKGNGIGLSDFKVTFHIQKMPATIFNGFVGNIKIYNLSQETQNRIKKKEFLHIKLIAGYDGIPPVVSAADVGVAKPVSSGDSGQANSANYGVIFSGDIRFFITGKDNLTDSWILLQCIDSWEGHLNSKVKTTVSSGWKYNDLFSLGMKSYAPYGIQQGSVPEMPTTVFPRGRVIYQNTAELMYHVADQCKADWWYEDKKVNLIPQDKYLQEAIVLNSNTGLIGMPQQTMGAGVNVRCLINPRIKLGGLIRLDQASIYRQALSSDQVSRSSGMLGEQQSGSNLYVDGVTGSQPASINTDGDYIVGSMDYTGDTRGQAWYIDLLCLAKGGRDLLNSKGIDATQYP